MYLLELELLTPVTFFQMVSEEEAACLVIKFSWHTTNPALHVSLMYLIYCGIYDIWLGYLYKIMKSFCFQILSINRGSAFSVSATFIAKFVGT